MKATTWLDTLQPGSACTVIAEVSQSHDGSLGMAHAFIDAAANAGADAIKFQTHIASAESTPSEPWRKRFSFQDATRYDYWRRMEFTEEQWCGLQRHAQERDLHFLSSAFSLEAVQLLQRVGVAAWKVASGEINNAALLEAMAASQLPILLSTGMSTLREIDSAAELVRRLNVPLAVLQCTSLYPCPPEHLGLNVIGELRARYDCAVGLSDHSATIYSGLAAATLGIEILEVHIALSRDMFGPDVIASITPQELRALVDGIRYIECARNHPVDKTVLPDFAVSLRAIFMKSVVAAMDLPAGITLRAEHLAQKKPGTGIPAQDLPRLLGLRLRRAVSRDALLAPEDLEE